MIKLSILTGLILAAGLTPLHAAKLGDPAAPIVAKEWVKGNAVNVQDGKNIYVVEFWATWCPPCKETIPYLTDLQRKYKDKGVVIIGVSSEEVDDVKPFVQKQGTNMAYTVVCDKTEQTAQSYMLAFGQEGIPTAFVVNKEGKVIWIGSPIVDNLGAVIDQILAGKYDLQAFVQRQALIASLQAYLAAAASKKPEAKDLGQKVLTAAEKERELLIELSFQIAVGLEGDARDFILAQSALEKAGKLGPTDHILTGARAVVLFEAGKQIEGIALAKEAVNLSKNDMDKMRYQHFIKVMENRMKSSAKPDEK